MKPKKILLTMMAFATAFTVFSGSSQATRSGLFEPKPTERPAEKNTAPQRRERDDTASTGGRPLSKPELPIVPPMLKRQSTGRSGAVYGNPLSTLELLSRMATVSDLFEKSEATMECARAIVDHINPSSSSTSLLSVLRRNKPMATKVTIFTLNRDASANDIMEWYKLNIHLEPRPSDILVFDLRKLRRIDADPLLTDPRSPLRQHPFILQCPYASPNKITIALRHNYQTITFDYKVSVPPLPATPSQFTLFIPQ